MFCFTGRASEEQQLEKKQPDIVVELSVSVMVFLGKCISNRMNVGTRIEVTLKEDGIDKY